jgi:site-specific DNA-methyltransferase (adenine-specific)
MAVRVEDAGFEIRDQIMWIYGSGFPKSMNIGKAMDKVQGNERKVIGKQNYSIPKADNTIQASSYGISGGLLKDGKKAERLVPDITKGNSEYEGWGTALKPAHEPIVMARKPLSEKTVVDNVLEWGTGGINVEESRIPYKSKDDMEIRKNTHRETNKLGDGNFGGGKYSQPVESGRFPSNIIFDEEAGKILDEQSGISKSTGGRSGNKEGVGQNGIYGQYSGEVRDENPGLGDIGGASRFFYCPKTSKTDRNEGLEDFEIKQTVGGGGGIGDYQDDVNSASGKFGSEKAPSKNNHPTVKPTDLMLYLIRLVTPKGGTTLDPFMGSGSTGKAATRGGFDFIGIEREKDYMEIAKTRIQYEKDNPYNEEKKERVKINKNANKFF